MDCSTKKKSAIEETVENLFDYAVDRTELKTIMAQLPPTMSISTTKIEYELQLLKILAVGWSITYYLAESPLKDKIATPFWQSVNTFAHGLSQTTEMMIGNGIDYFQVLKERLTTYVEAMNENPQAPEPAVIIGPEFARACGNKDDIYAVRAGSRMFITVIGNVKTYLEEVKLR